jgi:hypothetical protein
MPNGLLKQKRKARMVEMVCHIVEIACHIVEGDISREMVEVFACW